MIEICSQAEGSAFYDFAPMHQIASIENTYLLASGADDDGREGSADRPDSGFGRELRSRRLLIIDDAPDICALLRVIAEEMGFSVAVAQRSDEFRRIYRSFQPTEIVLDLLLPGDDGLHLLKFMRDEGCEARIIVLSGLERRVRNAATRIADAYGLNLVANMQKPARIDELRAALDPPPVPEESESESA